MLLLPANLEAPAGLIGPADLGLAGAAEDTVTDAAAPATFRQARDDFERSYFSGLLKRARGSVAEAARLSGIARQNLYVHFHRLGLDASKDRNDADLKI